MARFVNILLLAIVCTSAVIEVSGKNRQLSVDLNHVKKGALTCSTCVNLFEHSLSLLISIIVNGGVIGSCEALCGKLTVPWEQVGCTLACGGVGIEAFIEYLNTHDDDPLYLCTDLLVCPRNHCNSTTGDCITIDRAYVTPSVGPVRTTFKIQADITVKQQTGTGSTQVIVTTPGPVNETSVLNFAMLNEGYAPGKYTVSVPMPTDQDDWSYPLGIYKVEVDQCGSDCNDKYGVVFATAYTQFNLTKRV